MDLLVFYCYGHFINGCAIYLMGRNKTVLSSEEKKDRLAGWLGVQFGWYLVFFFGLL
jgi:hypothetical protein